MERVTAVRLELYRRAARALNLFCTRWVQGFCQRCLEVTRRHHGGDPRADVELAAGVFPGCCHAGAGDALYVPGWGERGHMPDGLRRALLRARRCCAQLDGDPLTYQALERGTRRTVRGVACAHFSGRGCNLQDLKGPLCLTYFCDPVREVLLHWGGEGLVGRASDDFAGLGTALGAVFTEKGDAARAAVVGLEGRLRSLGRRLEEAGFADGASLCRTWFGGAVDATEEARTGGTA